MTKDKAAKVITNIINSRAKFNKADEYLKEKNEIDKIKNYSRNQLERIFKKILGYKNNADYFDKGATHTIDLKKYTDGDLIKKKSTLDKTQ